MKNRKRVLTTQPHMKTRKKEILNLIRKYPDMHIKKLTMLWIEKNRLSPENNSDMIEVDRWIQRRYNDIKYTVDLLLKDGLVEFREVGAQRGAWLKKIWRVV